MIFFKTHRLLFLILASLGLLGGMVFALLWPKTFQAEVFFTVGLHSRSVALVADQKGVYDLGREADEFTNTVQGWLLFPETKKKILASASLTEKDLLSFKPKKQERQNVVVFLGTGEEASAQRLASAVLTVLRSELQTYYANTGRLFVLTNDSWQVRQLKQNIWADAWVGALLGILLAGLIAVKNRNHDSHD
jgi:hypothetical protein